MELKNVAFFGFKGGIKSNSEEPIDAQDVMFINVDTPYDVKGAKTAKLVRNRVVRTKDYKRKKRVRPHSPESPALPVFCDQCQSIFPSDNYFFASTKLESSDNTEECPECHFLEARLLDGLFEITGDIVKALQAPDLSISMLNFIGKTADKVVSGEIDAQEAISEFEKVSPQLAEILRKSLAISYTALILSSAAAGIGSVYYSREQTSLAQEQTAIAREQLRRQDASKTDIILERIFDRLSKCCFTSHGVISHPQHKNRNAPSGRPTTRHAPAKTGSEELMGYEDRDGTKVARQMERARRLALGRSRSR